VKKRISLLLASGFYLGLIPGARGTYASVATALVFYFLQQTYHRIPPELHMGALGLITVIGVIVSAEAGKIYGCEDPPQVVIDEISGQLAAFLFLPPGSWNLALATVLFRIFDIWKPFPIYRLETLKNGVGVMADDLLAGCYANALLQVAYWLLHR
jgi:phosphatidylglycerophosphatase A